MILFCLLVVIFLAVIITAVWLYLIRNNRNYFRRIIIEPTPCPFSKTSVEIVEKRVHGSDLTVGCDSTTTDQEVKIVSYSLYGNYAKYSPTLISVLKIMPQKLPGWRPRIYIGTKSTPELRNQLYDLGADLYIIEEPRGHEGQLWRFLPAGENVVFASLDADDTVPQFTRMVPKILEWYKSGKTFARLNEFKLNLPMMAGRWAGRGAPIPDIVERIEKYCEHWFGFDEMFLRVEIWPIVQEMGYWHDYYFPVDKLLSLGIVILVILMVVALWYAYRVESKCRQLKSEFDCDSNETIGRSCGAYTTL